MIQKCGYFSIDQWRFGPEYTYFLLISKPNYFPLYQTVSLMIKWTIISQYFFISILIDNCA